MYTFNFTSHRNDIPMTMEGWDSLGQILLLLVAAVGAGVLLESLGVNSIIGYLLAGVLVGPSALDLVGGEGSLIELIAELGVALLLFAVGLEITPGRLRQFGWRGALVGVLQVGITGAIVTILCSVFGVGWQSALVLGALVAMSSTAVVVRLLADRSVLDAPHGRNTLAVLLSQDVIVVPLMILVSVLGSGGAEEPGAQLGKAALSLLIVIGALCLIGLVLLPRILGAAVLRRNRDFAIVLAIATCLVSAWGSYELGLPPALGAFVSGLVLAGSAFARQIRADTSALRAVFLTLFFASVGMLAEIGWLFHPQNLLLVLTFLLGGLVIKGAATAISVRLCGGTRRVAIESALCLAQFGEFSFVLGSVAFANGVLSETLFQAAISASFLSLLATPFLVANCRSIASKLDAVLVRSGIWKHDASPQSEANEPRSNHVIIAGFGPAGEEAAHLVQLAGLSAFVIEMNPGTMFRAKRSDIPAMIGDATQREILEHAHVQTAAAAIVALPDTEAAISAVSQIRAMNKDAIIVVRARYQRRAEEIRRAGADHVLNEENAVGTLLGATVVSRITGMDAEIPEPIES